MKAILILFFINCNLLLAKGGEFQAPENPVETLSSTDAVTEITSILDEVLVGTRFIINNSCSGISYTNSGSLLDVVVDSRSYYLLQSDQTIGTVSLLESSCTKTTYDSAKSISCVARTVDLTERDKSITFTFKYGTVGSYKALYTCPF